VKIRFSRRGDDPAAIRQRRVGIDADVSAYTVVGLEALAIGEARRFFGPEVELAITDDYAITSYSDSYASAVIRVWATAPGCAGIAGRDRRRLARERDVEAIAALRAGEGDCK
jgi:hypothetical protein